MTALPGRIGRYRILGLLGKGAMGTVYRGRDESLERDVAVKVMSIGQADEDARHRFLREGKAAGRLQHPNIVTIYELGEHEGQPFMALELLEGMDLQRAIEAGMRPDPKFTLPIVLHLLAGLGHAHEHAIVHRDVKPSNVFLPRGRPAKIMDFGVARLAGRPDHGRHRDRHAELHVARAGARGRPRRPERPLLGRADPLRARHWGKAYQADSVVALLFKIVQEDPDFERIPKGEPWKRLRAVLRRSLQKKPEDRYPDARAMAAELELALRDLGGSFDPAAGADQALLRGMTPRPTPIPTFVPAPTAAGPAAPAHLETAPGPGAALSTPQPPARSNALWLGGGLLALGVAALVAVGYLLLAQARPRTEPAVGAAALPAPAPTGSPAPNATAARPSPSSAPARPLPPSALPSAAPSAAPAAPRAEPETPTPSAPAPGDARIDRANEHMEKGRYAQALAEARAVLARDPDHADAKALAGDAEAALVIEDCVKKARAALKAGDHEAALAEARKGLAVNPSDKRLLDLFREATQ